MVTRIDYAKDAVEATHSVLLELTHLLAEYRDEIVVIGGWVPPLLLPHAETPHVGSLDIDLALDHRKLQEEGYRTIQGLLLSRGYRQGGQPFIFHRKVSVKGREVQVEVDLMAGEYGGTGKTRRHQQVQGVLARKARGCDLPLDMPTEVVVEGRLPNGAQDAVRVRVASIVPFLIMKGMALDDRVKEKDAWDIYYCLCNFPGGVDALIDAFRAYLDHGLVREGLQKISKHFHSPDHVGPRSVAEFEGITDPEARAITERDAYERVRFLLNRLGVKSVPGQERVP